MRALKANSLQFSLPIIWGVDTLKRIEKIIQENAFDKKKNKPRLKLTPVPGLLLTGIGTTEPWEIRDKVK